MAASEDAGGPVIREDGRLRAQPHPDGPGGDAEESETSPLLSYLATWSRLRDDKDSHILPGNHAESRRLFWSVMMVLTAACSAMIAAIDTTLINYFAFNCGVEPTYLGTLFLYQGLGAILGFIISIVVFERFPAAYIMSLTLLCTTISMYVSPNITKATILPLVYVVGGTSMVVLDTGSQVVLRTLYGKDAGPWLGAQTTAFSVSGILVPIWEVLSTDYELMLNCVGTLMLILTALIAVAHAMEACTADDVHTALLDQQSSADRRRLSAASPSHIKGGWESLHPQRFRVELVFGLLVATMVGFIDAGQSYLYDYAAASSLPDYDGNSLVLVFFIACLLGGATGILDQVDITTETLYLHTDIALIGSALGAAIMIVFSGTEWAAWTGASVWGFLGQPVLGFALDLNNRLTEYSEVSASVPTLMFNLGEAAGPFIVSVVWDAGIGSAALPWGMLFASLVSIALLAFSRCIKNNYR